MNVDILIILLYILDDIVLLIMCNIEVSIKDSRGYGHILGTKITLYLRNILLHISFSEMYDYIPLFNTIEDGINDTIIHELIHIYTGEGDDALIDGWKKMLCSYYNGGCSCPVDCAVRDITLSYHE